MNHVSRHVVSLKDLGVKFHDSGNKTILARLAAILAILSGSRECIGRLKMFYKKVFRSTPPRHGDTLILTSREPVKSQIRSVSVSLLYLNQSTDLVELRAGLQESDENISPLRFSRFPSFLVVLDARRQNWILRIILHLST